ncbi:MAG: VWA domain-containing protein, partial [Proteobacteria bacterium]|nr:VWA domain-containing protein [Pseudomonadota bacterium]
MTAVQPISPTLSLDSPHDKRGLGGLVAAAESGEVALPLQEVRVRASIAGDCCRTVIDQRFTNTLDVAMEAVHIFPLPEEGAVTEVELHCGDLVVRADCKERQEAEQVFDEARQAGHRAALLTAERDDVHTLRITNLPAKEAVTVRIVIVERLESIDGSFRWRFPTTIPPRYLPGEARSHDGPGVLPDTDAVGDASRLQPPLRLQGGTKLDLEVELAGPLTNLESSLHAVRIGFDESIRIAPSQTTTLNKDFVLAFSAAQDDKATVRAYTDGTHTLVVVEPPAIEIPDALPRDAVFVVDISGSMSGPKMDAAKKALQTALHGLLPGDRFRLIAFDDRVEQFGSGFTAYDERTLAKADRWVAGLAARGGTEMLPAIK